MLFTRDLSNITRLNAFLIHLSISLVIFFILLYFILVQWYPQPLFSNDGGWRVIRIIAGVHLVLGPLLTLIVFKPGKAGLKFDLSMIVLVQTMALTWGIWTAYYERPAAVIYTLDFFTPVPAYQLTSKGITREKLKQLDTNSPALIYSDISKKNKEQVIRKSFQERKPIYLYTEYYTKFSNKHAKVLKENSLNLEKYVKNKPELKKLYDHALLENIDKTNIAFFALHSREKWVTAIFDLNEMKIIDTIDIDLTAYTYSQKIIRKEKDAIK